MQICQQFNVERGVVNRLYHIRVLSLANRRLAINLYTVVDSCLVCVQARTCTMVSGKDRLE